jgi:HEAT repeat protein
VSLSFDSLTTPPSLAQMIRDILGFAGLHVAGLDEGGSQGSRLEIIGEGKIRGQGSQVFRGLDGRYYEASLSMVTTIDLKVKLSLDPSRPVEKLLQLSDEQSGNRIDARLAYSHLLEQNLPAVLLDALRETEGLQPLIAALEFASYRPAAEALLIKQGAISVKPLQDSFASGNYELREGIARVLSKLGDASVVETLISGLSNLSGMPMGPVAGALDKLDPQWRLRPQTARLVENLLKGLKSGSSSDVSRTIRLLAVIGDERALPELTTVLRSDDLNIRCDAVSALGTFGKAGIPGLATGLRDKEPTVRKYAVEAMGQVADGSTLPYLIAALKDSSRDVRFYATLAFLRRKERDKMAVHALIDTLKDEDGDVRTAAAESLAAAGDPDAIGPLIDALANEKTPRFKTELQESLETLTNQHFGENLDQWRAWFATITKGGGAEPVREGPQEF